MSAFNQIGIRGDDARTWLQAFQDFHMAAITAAKRHGHCLIRAAVIDEHHIPVTESLQCAERYYQCDACLATATCASMNWPGVHLPLLLSSTTRATTDEDPAPVGDTSRMVPCATQLAFCGTHVHRLAHQHTRPVALGIPLLPPRRS